MRKRPGPTLPVYDPMAEERSKVLTPREKQVCELIAQGLTNREIAEKLFIAEGTVKMHVYSSMKKTGLKKRVRIALRFAPPLMA